MKARYSPTMDQIAKEVGVSVSTVSRVINCRESRISAATKERILEAASRLGYSPNFLASSLSKGRGSGTIGLCVGLDEFYARVVDGMIEALGKLGYAAILMPARPGGPGEQDVFKAFVERRVEGVIMRPSSFDVKSDYFRELDERGMPIVLVDVELHDLKMPFSGCDDYAGGRMAGEKLLSLGHRHLAHIPGSLSERTGILRKAGFLDAIGGVEGVSCVFCRHEAFTPDLPSIIEMLKTEPRPTAVFAANDFLARGAYEAAYRLGMKVPDDLSVLGFADIGFAAEMIPPLSTFDQTPDIIGRNAVELLFSLFGNERKPSWEHPVARYVTPIFKGRESLRPLGGGLASP